MITYNMTETTIFIHDKVANPIKKNLLLNSPESIKFVFLNNSKQVSLKNL